MLPVAQTVHGVGGNAFQACIASVLRLPIDRIPPGTPFSVRVWEGVQMACARRGAVVMALNPADPLANELLTEGESYYIALGRDRDGKPHAVVMRHGENFYDPSRSGRFLSGPPWCYVLILEEECESI